MSLAAGAPRAAPAAAALLGLPADAPLTRALLLASFDVAARGRLETALEALESAGTAFDLDARLADGSRLLALHGRCAAPGAGATPWLADRAEQARQPAALKIGRASGRERVCTAELYPV